MRGAYDKAIASYDQALTAPEIADFIEASIYSDRGVAKWRLKQTKEAIEDFNKSIQLAPDNASGLQQSRQRADGSRPSR